MPADCEPEGGLYEDETGRTDLRPFADVDRITTRADLPPFAKVEKITVGAELFAVGTKEVGHLVRESSNFALSVRGSGVAVAVAFVQRTLSFLEQSRACGPSGPRQ